MKKIKLTQGKHTIVDDEDFEWLNQWHWWEDKKGYIRRWRKLGFGKNNRKVVYLHRLLMNPKNGCEVDHIDGNKLDNRKINLRIVTHSQNTFNRRLSKNNTSGYKGVFWDKKLNKWFCYLSKNRHRIRLGYFKDKFEAAKQYNKFALVHFGEFANLNKV